MSGNILGNIPIIGGILGGSNSSQSLMGLGFDMTGIPQLVMTGVVLYVGVMILLKLVDKI